MVSESLRYRVTGMDCTDCVTKIDRTVRSIEGISDVRVSLTSQSLTFRTDEATVRTPQVEDAVTALGYHLERDTGASLPTHLAPSYRRALWIVVLLNAGYGVIELVGGFLSDSQALKADALDFLGDGAITFLGLLAIGWGMIWRARSALIQGYFLGALGLGVLLTTAYRVIVPQTPEAELMTVFGAIALVINIAAALVLLPHRAGDANARAVWLFSRNDALGNLAVVIAAGVVALTGSPWPDLLVAFVIAGLFLHSAWSIITDARRELETASASTP